MIAVKQELLAGLAAELEKRVPGAGARAAFETPKSAAHGDLASNAAMQLAKPLKLNPRQLAESLKADLMAQPVYQQWVQAIEIAGPGFINFRLQPAARQQVVREVLEAGARGFILKTDAARLLLAAVESLAAHQPFFTGRFADLVLGGFLDPAQAGTHPGGAGGRRRPRVAAATGCLSCLSTSNLRPSDAAWCRVCSLAGSPVARWWCCSRELHGPSGPRLRCAS